MGDYIREANPGGAILWDQETKKMLDFLQELNNLGVQKYIDLPQVRNSDSFLFGPVLI